ncbi:MAG: hypothetical protein C5B52_09290 [Bacteroidetes bacterium]|nr:MAG: hypothetical protein C5B52_09290 [Bacteroidota bacterium]
MKFFDSPLSISGFMISLASILLLTIMVSRNFWPTSAYFYTGGFGILMMLCDYFFIRRNSGISKKSKWILETILTFLIIGSFLLMYRLDFTS